MNRESVLSINEVDIKYYMENQELEITKGQLSEIATIVSDRLRGEADENFWNMFSDLMIEACNLVLNT